MNDKQTHTPTPWQLSSANAFHRAMIFAYPNHKQMAIAAMTEGDAADDNAAHIVHCVNAHDKLVAALRDAEKSLGAVSGLLHSYPRPSNDPNGRTLLNAEEHAKAACFVARAVLAEVESNQE